MNGKETEHMLAHRRAQEFPVRVPKIAVLGNMVGLLLTAGIGINVLNEGAI